MLDGLQAWLRERFIRHRGNADVVRQDLLAEQGVAVSRRTPDNPSVPQAVIDEAMARDSASALAEYARSFAVT